MLVTVFEPRHSFVNESILSRYLPAFRSHPVTQPGSVWLKSKTCLPFGKSQFEQKRADSQRKVKKERQTGERARNVMDHRPSLTVLTVLMPIVPGPRTLNPLIPNASAAFVPIRFPYSADLYHKATAANVSIESFCVQKLETDRILKSCKFMPQGERTANPPPHGHKPSRGRLLASLVSYNPI